MLSAVVEHKGTLFLAGMTGKGADIAEQTADIMAQIEAQLAANGVGRDGLLTAIIYITDLSLRPAANDVWQAWFPAGAMPARTSIGVKALMPGELIEIQVTAAAKGSGPIKRHLPTSNYSGVVEHAGLLYFAGCSMHDEAMGMAEQTKGALDRLSERLAMQGCGVGDVLSAIVFIDDMEQLAAMNDVYAEWKGDDVPPPARALVGCALGGPETCFTIMAVAATKEFPIERLGEPGGGHGPVRHNGRLYVSGMVCLLSHPLSLSLCRCCCCVSFQLGLPLLSLLLLFDCLVLLLAAVPPPPPPPPALPWPAPAALPSAPPCGVLFFCSAPRRSASWTPRTSCSKTSTTWATRPPGQ
eukprot:SAG22_NODE_158_length_16966_cov_26.252446_3_plen_355_part_00